MRNKRRPNRETRVEALRALWALRYPCGVSGTPVPWRDIERVLGINRGYLSAILRGRKHPSQNVVDALGVMPVRRERTDYRKKYAELSAHVLAGDIDAARACARKE